MDHDLMCGVRTRSHFGRVLLSAVLIVLASACWDDDNDSRLATYGLPTLRQAIEDNDWVLDRADSSLTIDDDNPVTLSIRGDSISGMAPCNTYQGTFDLDGDDVEIRDIARTLRACEDRTTEAEDEFFRALEASETVHVADDRLVLTNGGIRLSFQKSDADSGQ